MDTFLGIIARILLSILVWLILFPVVMILATPVILTVSMFGRNGNYPARIANGYCSVFDFWQEFGWFFL